MAKKELKYTYLNLEALSDELGVRDEVYKRAEQWTSKPSSVPVSWQTDEGEQRIIESATDGALSWSSDFFDDERLRRSERSEFVLDPDFPERIRNQTQSDLYGTVLGIREEREQLLDEYQRHSAQLSRIKVYHNLSREPRYAKNRWFTWVLVAVFLTVEIVTNGGVLANAMVNGQVGGWSLASIVSLTNIVVGGISGMFLPRLWASIRFRRAKRTIALVLGIIAVLLVLALNLAVAYVRTNGAITITTDITAFWRGDILPGSLESLSLFLIGSGVALVTALKFAFHDDPVRDFQKSDQQMSRLAKRIAELDQAAPDMLQQKAEHGGQRIAEAMDLTRTQVIAFRKSLIESETSQSNYENGFQRIRAVHQQCIDKRRGDLAIASTHVPSYWSDPAAQLKIIAPKVFDLETEKADLESMLEQTEVIRVAAAKAEASIEVDLRRARVQVELVPHENIGSRNKVTDNVVHMRFRNPIAVWD